MADGSALEWQSGLTGLSVLTCALDDDRDMPLVAGRALLTAEESARAERFHFPRDRDRFIRGRGFLRVQLGRATGQDPARLVLETGPMGKPRLAAPGPEFNLSHSGDLAVLAISDIGPVGIDVEFPDRRVDVGALSLACFTGAELDTLRALDPDQRAQRFFAFWVAKEARMKLTGEGMSLPPKEIVLDLRDGWPVGYLRPHLPQTKAIFVELRDPRPICCVSVAGVT